MNILERLAEWYIGYPREYDDETTLLSRQAFIDGVKMGMAVGFLFTLSCLFVGYLIG